MRVSIFLIVASLCLASCRSDKSAKTNAPNTKSVHTPILPTLDSGILQELMEKCESTDYIFTDLPYSMSLSDEKSIRQNLALIDSQPCTSDFTKGKHFGRQHFIVEGDLKWIADIYFGKNCNCYVFNENGKPKYANAISQAGINFYNNMINNIKASPQQ